jgi:uncharacterized repeat protein (TIGR03803 family)
LFLASILSIAVSAGCAQAQTYATIYSFKGPEGGAPHASVIISPQGQLFGTAYGGGAYNYGAVFELSNPTGNAWIENTLYSFGGGPDGQYPQANVVFGPGGALYGTTVGGGAGSVDGGTIFELAPPAPAGGAWTESVLYGFPSGVGVQVDAPFGAVLFDKNGNLYSTARGEYLNVAGGVVELMPPAMPGGTWTESTVFTFGTPYAAGKNPFAGLVSESGSLYGTDYFYGDEPCGVEGCGAVYELTPPAAPGDAWTITSIYDFAGPPDDGGFSWAPLTLGTGGVLYGTTLIGGPGTVCTFEPYLISGCGTVFELTPPAAPDGTWTESVLYSFTGVNGDGAYPFAPVVLGKDGALYGTTQYGGITAGSPCKYVGAGATGCGTVFELTPPAEPGGAWIETILHSFTGEDGDGAIPTAGLAMSSKGVLYGTTSAGGTHGNGTVFAVKP